MSKYDSVINDYAEWTDVVWKSGQNALDMDEKDLSIVAIGMAGETGEALEHVKKFLRDNKDPRGQEKFLHELGDVIFYWARLVRWAGFTPNEVLAANVEKLTQRHERLLKERQDERK